MGGTISGGKAAAKKNIEKYGEKFYHKIGQLGGTSNQGNWSLRGFGSNRKLARVVGAIGGRNSKRGKAK